MYKYNDVFMLHVHVRIRVYNVYNNYRQLKHAREGVSHGGLGLLARHRRRQRLKAMLDILKSLKTLVHHYCSCSYSIICILKIGVGMIGAK